MQGAELQAVAASASRIRGRLSASSSAAARPCHNACRGTFGLLQSGRHGHFLDFWMPAAASSMVIWLL